MTVTVNQIVFALVFTALAIAIVMMARSHRDSYVHDTVRNEPETVVEESKYTGLVLFDIDGTLTTGTQNHEVVQMFLDRGYAVGIVTAGAVYTPHNLLRYPWMPRNLYDFMHDHDFDTFNNVASGILMGCYSGKKIYDNAANECPSSNRYVHMGWRKGIALHKTAEKYNIHNHKDRIVFDDLTPFLRGLHLYNPECTHICAGHDCGGADTKLTLRTAMHVFK